MAKPKYYESYPLWIVLVSNLVSIAIYFFGAYIMYQLGLIWMILYLLYIAFLEAKVMKNSCVNCYYYGKCCAFGRGKTSSWFFSKGEAHNFKKRDITWKDILPDFMVSIIPLFVGIALLILNFTWHVLVSVIALIILTSAGNAFVRGSLACKFCRQREFGCPAEKLFNKKRK